MMHYFLGVEVWPFPNDIFLNKGKYVVEILKSFGMMDCKAMNTSMVTNLKLLNDASSEIVDVTLYKHITGSLMYLTNTRADICFLVNTLSQKYGGAQTCSFSYRKTCDEVPKRYTGLWPQIYNEQ